MVTRVTVRLFKNVELVSQWGVVLYKPGEVEMPSDLARLCIEKKWAVPVKVLRTQ